MTQHRNAEHHAAKERALHCTKTEQCNAMQYEIRSAKRKSGTTRLKKQSTRCCKKKEHHTAKRKSCMMRHKKRAPHHNKERGKKPHHKKERGKRGKKQKALHCKNKQVQTERVARHDTKTNKHHAMHKEKHAMMQNFFCITMLSLVPCGRRNSFTLQQSSLQLCSTALCVMMLSL